MTIALNQPYSFCQLGNRDNQEDSRFPDTDVPRNFAPFFLVCDGVGGCDKGEVASQTVCEAFKQSLIHFDWTQSFTSDHFKAALSHAYSALKKKANRSNRDMATTLTFAAFHQDGCTVAHMGDSRIYHIRPHVGILYRSDDHSLVNALVHSGNMTPDEAINHPDSNIITRYISVPDAGKERSDATVMLLKDLCAGDYIFLCSDGVLQCLSDEDLENILASRCPDKDKMLTIAKRCVNSEDNNTAYLIPIKDVIKEEEVLILKEVATSDETMQSTGTPPFSSQIEQVHEISPDESSSFWTRICHYLKLLKK